MLSKHIDPINYKKYLHIGIGNVARDLFTVTICGYIFQLTKIPPVTGAKNTTAVTFYVS